MSAHKTRDIRAALLAKGFEVEDTHHEIYWLHVNGRKTSVRTRLSHGANEYGDRLLGEIAKQVRLSRGELDRLIACTLRGPDYATLMIERGHVRL